MAKEPFTITAEYVRGTIHNVYGKVVISAVPAPSFSFKSTASWPLNDYQDAVLKGILEVISDAGISELGAEIVLKEVGWRDEEYCWDSYYRAAKKATKEILQKLELTT